ncbi:hypothetical protein Hanom_Chr06g00539311 [Helianthus anomalus]
MHHVMTLIAERHGGPRLDTKLQSSRGSHWKQPLYAYGVEVRLSTSTLLRPYLSFAIGGIY